MVAAFEAGHELCLSFASLFSCDKRTENFPKNYATYIDVNKLGKDFIEGGGLIAVTDTLKVFSINSGEYIPILMIWPAAIAMTEILCIFNIGYKGSVSEFSDELIKRVLMTTQEELELLVADRYLISKFFKNIKLLLAMYLDKAEIQVVLDKITKKFLTTPTLSHDHIFNLNNKEEKNSLSLNTSVEELKTRLEEYKRQLKEVIIHKDISEFNKRSKERIPHINCDKQEFACLSMLRKLLQDGKLIDAKKLIQWRKGILELADYTGWEIAKLVAHNSSSKLNIEAKDIINV